MFQLTKISEAIKEVFGFLREWNNADQRQKRYALTRIKRIKQATDVAEEIFFVVDDMLTLVHQADLSKDTRAKLAKLEDRYKRLLQKFNRLD